MTVARVLPNVTGLDKQFDYLVPQPLVASAQVGSIVRVDLHGRRIAGWIVSIDPPDALDTAELKPIAKVTGHGPSPELIDLADWAAVRWAARRRHFLVAASPHRAVTGVPGRRRTSTGVEPRSPASTSILADGGGVLRLPPTSDPMPALLSAVSFGPTLAVVPAVEQAMLLAARLRRSGLTVAVMPNDWAAAAGGVDVVIGARAAAWAPCVDLAAAVVIDEHDEALQEEGSPTWHARDVLIERCRRLEAPLLLISPAPTLTALEWGPLTATTSRPRAGGLADRRRDRPIRRRTVEALARHVRADSTPTRSGAHRRVHQQHDRSGPVVGMSPVP